MRFKMAAYDPLQDVFKQIHLLITGDQPFKRLVETRKFVPVQLPQRGQREIGQRQPGARGHMSRRRIQNGRLFPHRVALFRRQMRQLSLAQSRIVA